jgi:hypothetical protein
MLLQLANDIDAQRYMQHCHTAVITVLHLKASTKQSDRSGGGGEHRDGLSDNFCGTYRRFQTGGDLAASVADSAQPFAPRWRSDAACAI